MAVISVARSFYPIDDRVFHMRTIKMTTMTNDQIKQIGIKKLEKSEITFFPNPTWIMRLSENGIEFNTEEYPVDKITSEIINLLCESFWDKVKEYYEKRLADEM